MKTEDRYNSLIQYWWDFFAVPQGDVDWRLVKEMIRQESNFDPRAISPAGAHGLLQIMKGTWNKDAEYIRYWDNPEENLRVGIGHLWYLWKLFAKESGLERWGFALGAYNCGQGNVIKAQGILKERGRAENLWANIASVLPEVTGQRSAETIGYVDTIMRKYLASRRGNY